MLLPSLGRGRAGTSEGLSQKRSLPAASGWAGSHPGNTADLRTGRRLPLPGLCLSVDNAPQPLRMQPPASLGGSRAAPETCLLEAPKNCSPGLFLAA